MLIYGLMAPAPYVDTLHNVSGGWNFPVRAPTLAPGYVLQLPGQQWVLPALNSATKADDKHPGLAPGAIVSCTPHFIVDYLPWRLRPRRASMNRRLQGLQGTARETIRHTVDTEPDKTRKRQRPPVSGEAVFAF